MNMYKFQSRFISAAFLFVACTAAFDPQNTLGLRPATILLAFFVWIFGLTRALQDPGRRLSLIVISYLLPAWGGVVYLARGDLSTSFQDTSYILVSLFFSFSVLLNNPEQARRFDTALSLSGKMLSVAILATAVELIFTNSLLIRNYFISSDIARVDFREYAGIKLPYVYFFASSFLVVPIAQSIAQVGTRGAKIRNHLLTLLLLVALFISGTRSHMIIALGLAMLYVIRSRPIFRLTILLVFAAGIMNLAAFVSADLIRDMMSATDSSNSAKLSMFAGYRSIFSDAATLVLGQGFGGYAWNHELKEMVASQAVKTELTYLEIVRVFGIPMSAVACLALVAIHRRLEGGQNLARRIVFWALLFDSALNPVLTSQIGALLLVFCTGGSAESEEGEQRIDPSVVNT